MANTQYGAEMRKQFPLLPGYSFTNHGSNGVVPKCVLDEKKRQLDEIECAPDRYLYLTKDEMYQALVETASKFLGADPKNLVITQNATTGLNSVIKSMKLKPGEAILVNSLTYTPVKNTCLATCARVEGTTCHVLPVKFPIESEDAFLEMYETFLQEHPEVTLAVIDYITSSTALLLPVERLIEVCRGHQVLVMVDGAHAPGQLPINIEKLEADFFTGTLDKWCFVPRGCAVLWVHPRHRDWVAPIITSYMYTQGFLAEFTYQGSMDYSSYLSIPAGLKFYRDVGGYDKIHAYNSCMSSKAAAMLAQAWGTNLLPVPESMRSPNMKCIRLPPLPYDNTWKGANALDKVLFEKYRVVSFACSIEEGEQLYVRISAQIYNAMEDYEKLKQAVLDIAGNSQ